jgi:valyl-tRNA synthetase
MTSEIAQQPAMAPKYNPHEAEARWYSYWEQSGYFKPDPNSAAPPFVITIPPPNVTGDLHLGHALTYGIEDIIGRFKRMQGFNTLILPGSDHAGIATQNVVEKQLASEGLTRHELGRERFLERVWEWKDTYATNIRNQFRAMGCSFDWSRERFTMDPGYVDAVLEFFIRLYEEGQIYRGWRVINWCPRCQSAISDIEVEDQDREDSLYYLRYPLEDGSGDIVVATVRPETILGDVAVAVNPDDSRYQNYVGKTAVLPLLDRPLQIVADPMVDPEFGTGAVKITPSHDFNDFEVAERHNLPMPIAIGTDARITAVGGPYKGETVKEARRSVLRDLDAGGFLVKTEPYRHLVPTCERCGTLLEPLLSEQWFMRMEELARPAIDVVNDGRVRFVPERWSRVYLDWMENIRPWTLSRQLWWGHRIPIYYCANGHAVAAKSWPHACTKCGAPIERQDQDVLDTWFSSALWPFATLGWPHRTEDLDRYYPTSFMNTSSQILYLWIARMIMTGLKFMGDIPFPVVLINPTILNEHGQRMSKSLGTGVDPLDMVREFGADALRYGLMTAGSTHQQDIRFSAHKVEQARNFANKVWNVARFIISNQEQPGQAFDSEESTPELNLTAADRWILSRLGMVTEQVTADLERFELSGAGQGLYDFIWSELADWYVEIAKLRLFSADNPAGQYTAQAVLWSVLDRSMRLLHPYMPFLTEEVWQQLRGIGSDAGRQLSGWESDLPDSIMVAPWPAPAERDLQAEQDMSLIMEVIRSIRATRSEYHVEAGRFIPATIAAGSELPTLRGAFDLISRLARVQPLTVYESLPEKPRDAVSLIVGDATIFLPLAEMTDVEAERDRLNRDLENTRSALGATQKKLANENFVSRAPEEVVARERERAHSLTDVMRRIEERLELLGK